MICTCTKRLRYEDKGGVYKSLKKDVIYIILLLSFVFEINAGLLPKSIQYYETEKESLSLSFLNNHVGMIKLNLNF